MTKTRLVVAGACVLALAALIAWMSVARRPAQPAAEPQVKATAAPSEIKLPWREYLSQAQLNEAIRTGELDRPVKSLLKIDRRMEYGDYKWDDASVGAGPTWIRVDLRSQILSVFRAGHEIGTAVILYGAESKETPPGLYHILSKAREHRSSIYDAEMPFTLRLTNDGVSIHASNVRWGVATHGCIGIPLQFAEKLFDAVKVNDEVRVIRRPDAANSPKS